MVFDGDSDNQDLATLADKLVKTDNTDFPLAEKAMYANLRMREIFGWIWEAYGGWVADDTNNSGEPEALVNLVTTARNVYAFATAQQIIGMEWLDSDSKWNPLKPITLEEIQDRGYAETNFMTTAGRPEYYRPVQNGVRIYPDSNAARNNALKAKLRRDITAWTSATTSSSPGFDSILHEAVACGMALSYAQINSLDSVTELLKAWDGNEEATKIEGGWKKRIKAHYGKKFAQAFPQTLKGGSTRRSSPVDQFVS